MYFCCFLNVSNRCKWNIFFSGFVCERSDVLSNGCCDSNSTTSFKFCCKGCNNSTGCCESFESCVSCCMNPVNVSQYNFVLTWILYKDSRQCSSEFHIGSNKFMIWFVSNEKCGISSLISWFWFQDIAGFIITRICYNFFLHFL